jgi:hypothetical protein
MRHGTGNNGATRKRHRPDVRFERLGVFDRAGIDSQPTAATEREARVAILHLGGLRDRKGNPRHRPRRIDSPLLQDKIVQTVLFERAANPKKRMKAIANDMSHVCRTENPGAIGSR